MLLIKKEENMTKVQENNNIYYYEVISKSNYDKIGIVVSMCKQHNFETILPPTMSLTFNITLEMYLVI